MLTTSQVSGSSFWGGTWHVEAAWQRVGPYRRPWWTFDTLHTLHTLIQRKGLGDEAEGQRLRIEYNRVPHSS